MTRVTKLTKLELQIMEIVWRQGRTSIREVLEALPQPRPAYTTIQTTVYRLEVKKVIKRVRKIGNAHIFEPVVTKKTVGLRVLDDVLAFFGGRALPLMAQLAETGQITRDDIRELERTVERLDRERPRGGGKK